MTSSAKTLRAPVKSGNEIDALTPRVTDEDAEQFFAAAREIVQRADDSHRYDAFLRLDYRRAKLLLQLKERAETAERELMQRESQPDPTPEQESNRAHAAALKRKRTGRR